MSLSRRQFMSRGLLAAAGGLTAPAWFLWLSEQTAKLQLRKYVQLAQPGECQRKWETRYTEAANTLFQGKRAAGLQPVPGQPGMFYSESGRIVGIRDFNEVDKWDTISIPRDEGLRMLQMLPIHNAKITGIS